MPRLITGLDAARVHANLERIREAIADAGRDPQEVDILAAVKYVPLEELGVLGEAGITLLGENRAQDLEAKATQHPEFRWHFIGQLQSRKVKQIVPHVELIHSVASESALNQLERHATAETEILLEVNVSGEPGKAGIEPAELPRYLERAPVTVTGLMTMPPFTEQPEESRRYFAKLRELAHEHGLRQLSMGTSQDFAVAAAEGATIVRIGTTLYT
jgi:pyridoxal phosphate enzyme (YggS family)